MKDLVKYVDAQCRLSICDKIQAHQSQATWKT